MYGCVLTFNGWLNIHVAIISFQPGHAFDDRERAFVYSVSSSQSESINCVSNM